MFPELKPHEGSWMVTHKSTGEVREFNSGFRSKVLYLFGLPDTYFVETAGDYLSRINEEAKA